MTDQTRAEILGQEWLRHRTHRLGVALYAGQDVTAECSDASFDGGDADPDVELWCNEMLTDVEEASDPALFGRLLRHVYHLLGVEEIPGDVALICQRCDETFLTAREAAGEPSPA